MLNKKLMILTIILVSLLAVSAVSAEDNATSDVIGADNVIDDISAIDDAETNIVKIEENDEIVSVEENQVTLEENDVGNFDELSILIENTPEGATLELNKDYKYVDGPTEGIEINKAITIDGKGHTLDGNYKSRAFDIYGNNVILKNITFTDCYDYYMGGAIMWHAANGIIHNSIFTKCSSSNSGGAIYWAGQTGIIQNSIFTKCSSSNSGGAIYWAGYEGVINNCSFFNCFSYTSGSDNSVKSYGGSIYWSGNNGILNNSNFENCYSTGNSNNIVRSFGGSIYWSGNNGILNNSNFENCYSTGNSNNNDIYSHGGSIYWYGTNGELSCCNFNNCSSYSYCSSYDTSSSRGGAVYWAGTEGNLSKSNFTKCYTYSKSNQYAKSTGGAIDWYSDDGSLTDSNFVNCYVQSVSPNSMLEFSFTIGGSIFWQGNKGLIKNSLFKNNYVKNGVNFRSGGGSIYANGNNILINNSIFINNTSPTNGSSIYGEGKNLSIYSSTFLNDISMADSEIFFYKTTGLIENSILTTNKNKTPIIENNGKVQANYNWWGNTAENYKVKPLVSSNINVDNWLYLKISADKNKLEVGESAKIKCNFNNLVSSDGVVSKYANSQLPEIAFNFTGDTISGTILTTNGEAELDYLATNTPEGFLKINGLGFEKLFEFNIQKGKTKISIPSVTTEYNGGKYLVITLKDNYGHAIENKYVEVTFNGKTSDKRTDSLGQVKLSTNGLNPKTYAVKVTFGGDDNYLKSYGSGEVIIKKATPKVTASGQTFDVKLKTKKVVVTLKDNKGPIKNIKLTLKINGKTYAAKTNSKGVATFKVNKLTKKGTYKATVSFNGNKNYNKITKKFKVTAKVMPKYKTVTLSAKYKWITKKVGKYKIKQRLWKVMHGGTYYNYVDIMFYKNGKLQKSSKYLSTYKYKENGKWKWQNWRHGYADHGYHRYITILPVSQIKVKWVV